MQTSNPAAPTYQFGNFELVGSKAELRKNGVPLRLPAQPIQVLLLLLERAGTVVTREEIQKLLWPGDTIVNFDVGLNRCIRQIRSVLLDDADVPRYIKTVPRVGYCFIAAVKVYRAQETALTVPELTLDSQLAIFSPSGEPKASAEPIHWRFSGFRVSGAVVIRAVLALSLIIVGLVLRSVYQNRFVKGLDYTVVPLANALGEASTPTFAPDGRQIAFVWNGVKRDNFDIYVKSIGSQEVLRLTNDSEIDYSPAWSPDGEWIAFCRGTERGGAIWLISPMGGGERKIIDIHSSAQSTNRLISWTPDGKWLVYSDDSGNDERESLFLINVQSREERQLTFPSKSEADMEPAIAPDGRTLAFIRDTGRGVSSIYLLPFRADSRDRVTPKQQIWSGFENVYCGRPGWTPDSKRLVFASNRTGEHQLWIVAAAGWNKKPERIGSLGSDITDITTSTDGKLAIVRERFDTNIWKFDLSAPRKGLLNPPVQAIASTRVEVNPSVSPDSGKIAFESNRSGFFEVWTSNLDGTKALPLTDMRNPGTGSPAWSNDGRRIAFDSRADGRARIYVIPAEGGKPVAITDSSGASVIPHWSPHDEWIYFSSDRTGRSEIWRVAPQGGKPELVTRNGGFAAVPSPDGIYLYYMADRLPLSSLRKLKIATGEERTIASSVVRRSYAPAQDGVYYTSGNPSAVQSLNYFENHSESHYLLWNFERAVSEGMVLSPDGRELFYAQLDSNGEELLLVENFRP